MNRTITLTDAQQYLLVRAVSEILDDLYSRIADPDLTDSDRHRVMAELAIAQGLDTLTDRTQALVTRAPDTFQEA